MKIGISRAEEVGRPVEYRELEEDWEKKHDELASRVRDFGLFS
jgi:hypothetical protein